MAPDTNKPRRKSARDEYGLAWSAKERGRPLRRHLLQHRVDEINDGWISAAGSHGDEPSREHSEAPPRDDRAG